MTKGTEATEGDGSPLAASLRSPSVASVPFVETSKAVREPNTPYGTSDLDTFEERAAIAEHEGGATCEEADWMAAAEQDLSDPGELLAAVADRWRRNLEALARRETSPRGRDCIAAALRFIAEGWAVKAAAQGWTELELFGTDPRAPWERQDRRGVAYLPFTPSAVTAECITYPSTGPRPMRRWRSQIARGGVPIWEVAP